MEYSTDKEKIKKLIEKYQLQRYFSNIDAYRDHFRIFRTGKKEQIFGEADKRQEIYILLSGEVKVCTILRNGRQMLLGYYDGQNLFGEHILEDIADWREVVHFPDLDAMDWEAAAARDLAGIDREEKVLACFGMEGNFNRLQSLMGICEAMIAMVEEPEEVYAFFQAHTEFKMKTIEKYAKYYKPDIYVNGDKLLIHGGWDSFGPHNYEDCTEEMVRAEVRRCIDTYGRGGNYALFAVVMGDMEDENIRKRRFWVDDECHTYRPWAE